MKANKKCASFLSISKLTVVVALGYGLGYGQAFAQGTIPTCNAFDTTIGSPTFGKPINTLATPNTACTDYFSVGNWANSPLPSGTLSGFTLISAGSGYVNPVVVISDPTLPATANPTSCTAAINLSPLGGSVAGLNPPTGNCTGLTMPQVTIVDVGAGGSLSAPTCGGTNPTPCGSGALATTVLTGPFTGGMPKCNGQVKPDTFLSHFPIVFPLKNQRRLIA
jgi:hypothetical protein